MKRIKNFPFFFFYASPLNERREIRRGEKEKPGKSRLNPIVGT
jgi:hypothetical protein